MEAQEGWAVRTSLSSSQGLLLLQLRGHRLPAAATTGQGRPDPHCGLGMSWCLAPSDPEPCGKRPEPGVRKCGLMS